MDEKILQKMDKEELIELVITLFGLMNEQVGSNERFAESVKFWERSVEE